MLSLMLKSRRTARELALSLRERAGVRANF